MGVSRVDFGGETLVDLTGDTVKPSVLLKGQTAHGADGEPVKGIITVPTKTSRLINDSGFVTPGEKVILKTDGEGGNIGVISPDGTRWGIDAIDNNLRIFTYANNIRCGIEIDKFGKVRLPYTPDFQPITTSLAVTQQGTSVLDGTVGKTLNDKITHISETSGVVRRGFGVMSIDNGTVIRGSISMEKISGKKCNLMIKARIEQREGSPDLWYLFDIKKVSALVALKSLSWEAANSWVQLDQSNCQSDGVIFPYDIGYGLCSTSDGNFLILGRIYSHEGNFGGYASNHRMYTPETVYLMWVQGADYTE